MYNYKQKFNSMTALFNTNYAGGASMPTSSGGTSLLKERATDASSALLDNYVAVANKQGHCGLVLDGETAGFLLKLGAAERTRSNPVLCPGGLDITVQQSLNDFFFFTFFFFKNK